MGNSLRCCLACILPCGALDVVRVVHLSGHVEELSRPVTAGEVMAANPNHILTKLCSQGATAHRILIVSPDSTLRRGSIYFLIPESSSSLQERRRKRKKKRAQRPTKPCRKTTTTTSTTIASTTTAVEVSDDGSSLTEVPGSEKKPGHRRRRSGRVAIWQPRLESITEDP